MMSTEHGKFLSTVPALTWWLSDKIENHKRKKRAKYGVDAIDNIERLYGSKNAVLLLNRIFRNLKKN